MSLADQREQRHRGRLAGQRDLHHGAAGLGDRERLVERARRRRALEHRREQRPRLLRVRRHRDLTGVDHHVRAHVGGCLPPPRRPPGGDDRPGPGQLERDDRVEPDRPDPVDENRVTRPDLRKLDRLTADRERLGMRSELNRQLGRQRDQLPGGNPRVLGVRALGVDPDVRHRRAAERYPARADPALPARPDRRRRDRLPLGPSGHVRAERDDPPAELVPEDLPGRGCPFCRACTSDPHRPHASTATMTSSGPGLGSGTSPTAVPVSRSMY